MIQYTVRYWHLCLAIHTGSNPGTRPPNLVNHKIDPLTHKIAPNVEYHCYRRLKVGGSIIITCSVALQRNAWCWSSLIFCKANQTLSSGVTIRLLQNIFGCTDIPATFTAFSCELMRKASFYELYKPITG